MREKYRINELCNIENALEEIFIRLDRIEHLIECFSRGEGSSEINQ